MRAAAVPLASGGPFAYGSFAMRWLRHAGVALFALASLACAGDAGVRVIVELGGRGDGVSSLELRVDEGECAFDAAAMASGSLPAGRIERVLEPSMPGPVLGRLPVRPHAVSVLARDASCHATLFGCASVPVRGGEVRVRLSPIEGTLDCGPSRSCVGSRCVASVRDGGVLDADGLDADTMPFDAGSVDAGSDDASTGACDEDADCPFGACESNRCDAVVGFGMGQFVTCVLRASGRVQCRGWNRGLFGPGGEDVATFTDIADLDDARALSVTAYHACALRDGGRLACWASGSPINAGLMQETPRLVVPGWSGVLRVSTGTHLGCARSDDRLECWGLDAVGQLGDTEEHPVDCYGAWQCRRDPGPVDGLDPLRVVDVAVGGDHGCAVTDDGRVHCWGRNDRWQVGRAPLPEDPARPGFQEGAPPVPYVPLPIEVAEVEGARAVASGDRHSCAIIREEGEVDCWGDTQERQCGRERLDGISGTTPVRLTLPPIRALALGFVHSCALTDEGEVWCWGAGANGALGRGTDVSSALPRAVELPARALELGAGGEQTCAVLESGEVWCWGSNYHGELGAEPGVAILSPVRVTGRTR